MHFYSAVNCAFGPQSHSQWRTSAQPDSASRTFRLLPVNLTCRHCSRSVIKLETSRPLEEFVKVLKQLQSWYNTDKIYCSITCLKMPCDKEMLWQQQDDVSTSVTHWWQLSEVSLLQIGKKAKVKQSCRKKSITQEKDSNFSNSAIKQHDVAQLNEVDDTYSTGFLVFVTVLWLLKKGGKQT